MMHRLITLVVISLFITPSFSQDITRIPPEKPRLIIGIMLSQMRYDHIYRFWDKFGDDGFKRMIDGGTFCKNTTFNYFFSQEGVSNASVATGTTPAQHGIIAKMWYDNLKDQFIGNTEDKTVKTVGSVTSAGNHSPVHLMTSTYCDELKLSNMFKSKIIGISLEPSSAILSAGHTADAAYWFDNENGNWISSTYYLDSLPRWVSEFNNKRLPDTYFENTWNTILPINEYTESLPDKNPYEVGFEGVNTFPYEMKKLKRIYKKNEKYELLKFTPYGDNFTKDFAVSAIVNEELGKDKYTDVLIIGFHAIEKIGKMFGPHSIEMEDALLRLDMELAHLLNFIDNYLGKENVLIYLTAEHGVADVPAYLKDNKIPAGYFNDKGAMALLTSYLNILHGKGKWVKGYHSQQIYLNRTLIEDSKISLIEMQNNVANFMLQFEGIANTITANTLITTNYTEGIFYKIQNGFSQKRSGDIIVNLRAGWVQQNEDLTDHNTSYAYDSRVPLIWYGWKIGRKSILDPVSLIDIAPTISNYLEISYPNACSGKIITGLLK